MSIVIKPSVLIVFVLCIAGYLYLKGNPKTELELNRTSGYHTFLWSASWGIGVFLRAILLYLVGMLFYELTGLSFSLGHLFLNGLLQCDVEHSYVVIFDLSIVSIALAPVLSRLSFFFSSYTRNEALLNYFAIDPETPEFTRLFFKSFEFGLPILFTMSDRKVYIGYVTEIHAKDFNDVNIIPIFSGYREKDTLELVPVTPYRGIISDVEDDKKEHLNLEAFSVSLPLREIVHAHLHDFRYYKKFKHEERRISTSMTIDYEPEQHHFDYR
ncbi:conserved membrane hypothetical protein [Vibrio crassostreae]|nr:conserved membrane hypothetical protein [Vibrio crassostreae]CAK2028154.1 conserved membrane hypothetical protein [Vibrio crassostreae]CAK2038844.1 conserved membrane hypothetical protein [Vibrio crassostreae]CAK2896489.1 conserved membrane hypothetical protein [Vibrio crassostreae]CAK2900534.1 conserved membrane hypothetical protein [Vibrio crassostreae]